MWVYSDYLELKQDFIPVFTEGEDKNYPGAWRSFIPHEGLRELLRSLVRALERARPADRRSLWLHGSYGTGKTFAVFVLKHLLQDPLESVTEYFDRHRELADLWERLNMLRRGGPYLVVYRSSSSLVNTPVKLLVTVQQSIRKAVDEQGYAPPRSRTIHEKLLEKLFSATSLLDWGKAFHKYRGQFVEFDSPEGVLEELRRGDLELAAKVTRVLEDEGFLVVDDLSTVKNWIREVLDANSLRGIVLIWDEFTDFFGVNTSSDTLQELAHFTTEIPFYMLLVTHRSPEQFRNIDDATRRKLLERFTNVHFEMRPVTAYQLMGNAISIRDEGWEVKRESLWGPVERLTTHLIGPDGRKEDFKKLIPLHPVSAYVLSRIAREFTSSQRTLFRLMKEDAQGAMCLWSFLQRHPAGTECYWFTTDYLWDYFFQDDNPELADRVRDIIAYYRSRVGSLQDAVLERIFKTVLLYMALWRQLPGEERLRPTGSNLRLALAGTHLSDELDQRIAKLCEEGFIHSFPVGLDQEYTIPLTTIDRTKLEAIRGRLMATGVFERSFGPNGQMAGKLESLFELTGAATSRQSLRLVPGKEFRNKRERVEPPLEPYQIGTVVVASEDDEMVAQADTLAAQLSATGTRVIYGVVQTPFGRRRMEDWVSYLAHYEYCSEVRDAENQGYYRQRSQSLVTEWVENIRRGRLRLYFGGRSAEVVDLQGYAEFFDRVVEEVYRHGPERISRLSTLYNSRFGKGGAEIGLGVVANIQQPYRQLVEALERDGLWNDEQWFLRRPDHPLSRMKEEVDKLFARSDSVRLNDVWTALMVPPYGLAPTMIGVALMGFLLRGYAQGHYWSDGTNCFPLNHNKLAELIEDVMKERRGFQEYVVRKMLPEAVAFCELLRDVFRLPPDRTAYPEEAIKALRSRLKEWGYPLWALRYALDRFMPGYDAVIQAIGGLTDMVGASEEVLADGAVYQIKSIIEPLKAARETLCDLARPEAFSSGMRRFWAREHHELLRLVTRMGLDTRTVTARLRLMMNEEVWLWTETKVKSCLQPLYHEFLLADALNDLHGGTRHGSLDESITYLTSQWLPRFGKLPLWFLAEAAQESGKNILSALADLVSSRRCDPVWAEDLAGQLVQRKGEVREWVADHMGALIRWARVSGEVELSEGDAEAVHAALPVLTSETDRDQVRREVRQRIAELARNKLVREVRSAWLAVTGTASPTQYSEQTGIPVHWVLESPTYVRLLDVIDSAERRSEADLRAALDFLSDRRDDLRILSDGRSVSQRFLETVAADYAYLVVSDQDVQSLKQHLRTVLGRDFATWQNTEARRATKEWITQLYRTRLQAEVLAMIDSMSGAETKGILGELAVDPLVGALLMKVGKGRCSDSSMTPTT